MGESGSGKTTVGRIIVGPIDPTAGSVRLHLPGGRGARGRPPKGKVQLVFQEPSEALDPRLKIRATIAESLQALSIERSEWRRRVRDTMGVVRLDPALLEAYPSELSAGQKQRVGVARAMITEPDLVVLDEPTSALDPTARAMIIDLFKRIQAERHTAYLFISHDLSTIRFISHRVAFMYLGMIVEQGEAATLFSQPHHPYSSGLLSSVLLPGGGKSHLAAALGLALVENGWRVLFTRTTDLVQKLQVARRDLALESAIAKLDKYHLLILDDLAYAAKDQAETSVLFELISARYERRSLLITANQPFAEWNRVFPNEAMTLAAVDRLVHHATIFEMNVESYRRRAAIERAKGPGRPPHCVA